MAKKKESMTDDNTMHPLMRGGSAIDDLLKRMGQREEQKEFQVEKLQEWKLCLNRLASTADGRYFLSTLVRFSGLFTPGNIRDTVKMVEDNGKQSFYLRLVRPYLDTQLRKDIE